MPVLTLAVPISRIRDIVHLMSMRSVCVLIANVEAARSVGMVIHGASKALISWLPIHIALILMASMRMLGNRSRRRILIIRSHASAAAQMIGRTSRDYVVLAIHVRLQ